MRLEAKQTLMHAKSLAVSMGNQKENGEATKKGGKTAKRANGKRSERNARLPKD